MKVQRLEARNFRSFDAFDLELRGRSVFLVGENGGGKSSLLTAIARGCGRDLNFTRADFLDPARPVELRVVLDDLDPVQQGLFANHVDFGAGLPTLMMEARSIWDPSTEDAETEHRFPRTGVRSRKAERDAVPLQWLPANRDPGRMLALGVAANLMGRALETLPLQIGLDTAVAEIQAVGGRLSTEPSLAQLLADAQAGLAQMVPDVDPAAFSFGVAALTPRDLLRQLDLVVRHLGQAVTVDRQSNGIGQLAVFVFAFLLARRDPGRILLIDEPEISLHPQAQRSLMSSLRALNSQMVVATHSPSLLDRADPRAVMRVTRVAGVPALAAASGLSDADATRMARFTTPQAAEAFFARSVVLVEGVSDVMVIEAIASRIGRNLDAEGVAIVPVGGASAFGPYHQLFGVRGLQLRLAGMCDEAEEAHIQRALSADGHPAGLSRTDREQLGYFVCSADLEDEMIRAIGDADVEQLIIQHGDGGAFATYQGQLAHRTKLLHEQLLGFLHGRKVEYAPILGDAVDLGRIPTPIAGLLARV